MAHHPTQYYSFNVFTSEEKTVPFCSFLLHKMPPKLFFFFPVDLALKTAYAFYIMQYTSKMCKIFYVYQVNIWRSYYASSSLLYPVLRGMMDTASVAVVEQFCT